MFGCILIGHGSMTHEHQGDLLVLLACVVHHSDWVLGVLEKGPSHQFGRVLFSLSPLQQELKINHSTLSSWSMY